jgi:HEAT repeat protein
MKEQSPELQAFLARIEDKDAGARMTAARGAGPLGAAAVVPLGDRMASSDPGVAKAAGEGLKVIVHHAARPGAGSEAKAVSTELARLLEPGRPRSVRGEAAYLLGFVGGDEAVPALARLLGDPELREDARLALERIPGRAATRALERALKTAAPEFRPNLEQSLRHRRLTRETGRTAKP